MSTSFDERCALGKIGKFHFIPRGLQVRCSSSEGTLLKRSARPAKRSSSEALLERSAHPAKRSSSEALLQRSAHPAKRSSSEALIQRSAPQAKRSFRPSGPIPHLRQGGRSRLRLGFLSRLPSGCRPVEGPLRLLLGTVADWGSSRSIW